MAYFSIVKHNKMANVIGLDLDDLDNLGALSTERPNDIELIKLEFKDPFEHDMKHFNRLIAKIISDQNIAVMKVVEQVLEQFELTIDDAFGDCELFILPEFGKKKYLFSLFMWYLGIIEVKDNEVTFTPFTDGAHSPLMHDVSKLDKVRFIKKNTP